MFCLSTHPLRYICIISTFWLLWMLLFGTFMYRFLCEHIFSFLLGVELLGHMETPCLTIWRTTWFFSQSGCNKPWRDLQVSRVGPSDSSKLTSVGVTFSSFLLFLFVRFPCWLFTNWDSGVMWLHAQSSWQCLGSSDVPRTGLWGPGRIYSQRFPHPRAFTEFLRDLSVPSSVSFLFPLL